MPTQVQCAAPILGTMLRVIKLNSCGVPVTGDGSAQIVMNGFVQVQESAQYDTGDRKITRLANGSTLCHNRKLPDLFTNDELTIDFCVWHPGLIVNTIGGRLLTASASPTGTGAAFGENFSIMHWSLELWQEVDGEGACDASGNQQYLYHAWPHISDAKKGQWTANNDPTQFQVIGNTYSASPLWTAGNAWLGTGQVQAGDHDLWNITTVAPPADACVIADYP